MEVKYCASLSVGGGIIYRPHTLEPLQKLGLDPHKAVKLALELHAHSIQYAYKLVSTQRALEKSIYNTRHICSQDGGSARHPPDPDWNFFFFTLVGRTHGAQALGVFLSLIAVGSASLPA